MSKVKLGYIIISHEDDYKNLSKTFTFTHFPDDSYIFVYWSGSQSKWGSAEAEISRLGSNCKSGQFSYRMDVTPKKCLEARKIAVETFLAYCDDCTHIQFIDSGDFVNYEDEDEGGFRALLEGDDPLYWSPVLISKDEVKLLLNGEAAYGYHSFNMDSQYYSTSYVVYEKSNVEKLGEAASGLYIQVNKYHDSPEDYFDLPVRCKNKAFGCESTQSEWSWKQELNEVDFAFQSPSIVAYPWKVELVKEVFKTIENVYGNFDVNMAEDLLFHTVARRLLKDKGNLKCKFLPPTYHYMAHEGSLTRSPYTIGKKLEVARISGFCANIIINGFPEKSEPVKESESKMIDSFNLKSLLIRHFKYSMQDVDRYSYLTEEERQFITPEDFDLIWKALGLKMIDSKVEEKTSGPITPEFTHEGIKVFQPPQKMWVWDDDDKKAKQAEVVVFEGTMTDNQVITSSGEVYGHCAVIDTEMATYKVQCTLVARRFITKEVLWNGKDWVGFTNQLWESEPEFRKIASESDCSDIEIQNITKL